MSAISFVICIDNSAYPASLERRKIYEVIVDQEANRHGQIRVIDESGEDYPYPSEYFVRLTLPKEAEDAIVGAA